MKSINECISLVKKTEKTYKEVSERIGSNHKSYSRWKEFADYQTSILTYLDTLKTLIDEKENENKG